VTFDTDLQHLETFGPDLSHAGRHWAATPVGGVIFEIKFTGRFPSWVEHMVCSFGLTQERCCKYALSVEEMLACGGASLAYAGFMLPPAAMTVRG
jgi:hypothetical protein